MSELNPGSAHPPSPAPGSGTPAETSRGLSHRRRHRGVSFGLRAELAGLVRYLLVGHIELGRELLFQVVELLLKAVPLLLQRQPLNLKLLTHFLERRQKRKRT